MPVRYFTSSRASPTPEPVEVERLDSHRYAVTYRERRLEVDTRAAFPPTLSLLIEGRSYQAEVEPVGEPGSGELRVTVEGNTHTLNLVDERTMRLRGAAAAEGASGRQTVRSPMPGKVVKLLVSVGDEVAEGQGLVVVEAMKMENELKSPKAGKVLEVKIQEGATVEGNAPLVLVE